MLDKSSIVNAAQKYASKGQLDKAIAEWEKLLEEKKDGNIHNNIGDLYLRKGAESEAIESFEKAAELFKKDGFFPKAIALHQKILNIVPGNVDSLIALAKLNAEKGLVGNAVENYFKAAEVFQREGSAEKTVMVIDKIVQLSPTDINTRKKIADLYMRSGHRERAANEYAEIATTYFNKNNDEKALEYFNGAIEFDNENVPAYIGLGKLSEKAGDFEAAFDYLEQVLPFDPDNLDLLTVYARVALKIGNNEGAKNALNVLVDEDPLDMDSKKQLGNIYLENGELEEAWDHLLPCIEEATSKQNWQEALEITMNFKELFPIPVGERIVGIYRSQEDNEALAEGLKDLAGLYENTEKKEDALNLYRELLDLLPDDSNTSEKVKELEISLGISQPVEEPIVTSPELMTDNTPEGTLEETSADTDMMSDMLMSTHEALQPDNASEKQTEEISQMDGLLMSNDLMSPEEIENGKAGPHENAAISPIEFSEKESKADDLAEQGNHENAAIIYRELLSLFPGNEGITRKLNALELEKSEINAAPASENNDATDSDLDDIFKKFGNEEPSIEVTTESKTLQDEIQITCNEPAKDEASLENPVESAPVKDDLQDIFSEFTKDEAAADTPAEGAPVKDDLQDIFSEFTKDEAAADTPAEGTPVKDDLQDIFSEFTKDEAAADAPAEDKPVKDDLQDFFSEFTKDEAAADAPAEDAPAKDDLKDIFNQFEPNETTVEKPVESSQADSDLEDIFNKFETKEEAVDYQAHYSTALDYKQKGLLDEAIQEFQIAARDPEKTLLSSSMVALCYMEKGAFPKAIESFISILKSLSPEDGSYLRMKYELAGAYRKNKDNTKALETYIEIQTQDPQFKDIAQQIDTLKAQSGETAEQPSEKPKPKKNRVSYI